MRAINLGKHKQILKIVSVIILFISLSILTISKTFAMQHYYNVDFTTGLVTATTLNVRSGPGTEYPVITTVRKNEYIRVFAGIGNWYIVQVEGDYIGAVSQKYIKPIYPNSNNTTNSKPKPEETTANLTADEQEVFNLINQQRANNGLSALKIETKYKK